MTKITVSFEGTITEVKAKMIDFLAELARNAEPQSQTNSSVGKEQAAFFPQHPNPFSGAANLLGLYRPPGYPLQMQPQMQPPPGYPLQMQPQMHPQQEYPATGRFARQENSKASPASQSEASDVNTQVDVDEKSLVENAKKIASIPRRTLKGIAETSASSQFAIDPKRFDKASDEVVCEIFTVWTHLHPSDRALKSFAELVEATFEKEKSQQAALQDASGYMMVNLPKEFTDNGLSGVLKIFKNYDDSKVSEIVFEMIANSSRKDDKSLTLHYDKICFKGIRMCEEGAITWVTWVKD